MSCPALGCSIPFIRERWGRSLTKSSLLLSDTNSPKWGISPATAQQKGKIQRRFIPLDQPRRQGHAQTKGKNQVDPWWKHGSTPAVFPFQISMLSFPVSNSSSHGAHQLFHTAQEMEITIYSVLIEVRMVTQGCPKEFHEQMYHCQPQLSLSPEWSRS